jgi:4-hydroxy-tetrahydrodipicolinate synthase
MTPPHGIICPLATPLDNDERVDERGLRGLLDYILPDIDGILALGSSAEYALLRPEVSERTLDIVLEHVAGRVPVYVGIGDTGTGRAVDNLRRLPQHGVECVVATSSYYYPLADQRALLAHFLAIAEAAPIPLVLYNIPQNTATNLAPATVGQLAQHPNVVGMKDSWGDMFQFQEYLALTPDGFPVLQGREQLAAVSLWAGADGVISALANIAPKLLQRLAAAARSGDAAASRQLQRRVTETARLFDEGYWLSALKVAIATLGFGSGAAARPLPPLSAEQIARVRSLIPQELRHG